MIGKWPAIHQLHKKKKWNNEYLNLQVKKKIIRRADNPIKLCPSFELKRKDDKKTD